MIASAPVAFDCWDLLYPIAPKPLLVIGDMTPEFGRGAERHAKPHHSEEDYAWSSLILLGSGQPKEKSPQKPSHKDRTNPPEDRMSGQ
jgi:hypothetical protein